MVFVIRFVLLGVGWFPCLVDVSGSRGRWVSIGFRISVIHVLMCKLAFYLTLGYRIVCSDNFCFFVGI